MFEILEKKFKGSRGHLAKFSWGGGKSGRVFEILGKKFKGSRGHLAKFSWRGMEKSSKSQSHVPRQGDRGTGGGK